MPTVVLVGTLDTKGDEYAYLRDRIREHGVDVCMVDVGMLGEPRTEADITRHEVAERAGTTLSSLAGAGDRGKAVGAMAEGAAQLVGELHRQGGLDGILGLGGTGGTTLITHAMRELPVGVPETTTIAADCLPRMAPPAACAASKAANMRSARPPAAVSNARAYRRCSSACFVAATSSARPCSRVWSSIARSSMSRPSSRSCRSVI